VCLSFFDPEGLRADVAREQTASTARRLVDAEGCDDAASWTVDSLIGLPGQATTIVDPPERRIRSLRRFRQWRSRDLSSQSAQA
jgi:hypothetical protein